MLDKIAAAYGEKCYEVPVGFKYISSKMAETGAFLGGEGSGGLTVAGHIHGKDAIYSAALLVETVAKTGKKLSQLMREVTDRFGAYYMEECNLTFEAARKPALVHQIYEEHDIPKFADEINHVSYLDGCKIFFKNGNWLLVRFSGTEPLLRIFAEVPAGEEQQAKELIETIREYYHI